MQFMPDIRPGPWLRLIAIGAAAAAALAVVSGALSLHTAHRVLAALAVPPLAALVAAAWVAHRRLLVPSVAALGLFIAAAGGFPSAWLFAVTMTGLALACGGASALNHVLDRDIDRHMSRTDRRPVAADRVVPTRALEFGLALSTLSFVLLASLVNVLTALLALTGNLFYVFVYTRWLKRSTPQNIVVGGAAGAIPPLVGWAAATGNVTVPALLLFAIVFFWTPPHFWALALLIRRDYEAAGVPMLPVVRGERETTKQIVLYSGVLVAVTASPFLWGTLGVPYLVAALVLGAVFFVLALGLRRKPTPRRAALLFHFSLLYLALLFAAMAVDAAL